MWGSEDSNTDAHTLKSRCPGCGVDVASITMRSINPPPKARGPRSGDFSVCCRCAEICRLDDNFDLKRVTASEFTRLIMEKPNMAYEITCFAIDVMRDNTPTGPVN